MQRIRFAVPALAVAGLVSLMPAPAEASPGDFGSSAFQSRRDCTSTDPTDPCNLKFRAPEVILTGGPGQAVNSSVVPGGGGSLKALVQFGELDLPTIKAGAWSGANTRVGSTIVTYMHYRYEGSAPTVYALDALVDWTTSASPGAAGGQQTVAGESSGGVWLWMLDAASVPAFGNAGQINGFTSNLGCGSAGVLGFGELGLTRATAGYHEGSIGLNSACGGGALMLTPGQQFVIMAQFQAVANRGGFLDATNTVRVQLSEDLPEEVQATLRANLVSARSLVPEPASWAMMIAGFGLVGTALRRQRTVHAA